MRIYPVILCGGSGTRLWPASRPSRPKQFIPLVGPRSLFQDTVERLRGLSGDRPPLVVAGEAHAEAILRQLAEIGVEGAVIIEPEGRDSAPAIAAAAAWIRAVDPEGVALVVASDHHIPDGAAFRASVEAGAAAAAAGRIVTFGVQPTGPATAYGYLQPGEPLSVGEPVRTLVRFVEKPDAETARAYVEAGYLWNSGNFVFSAKTLLEELALHAPALLEAVLASAPAPAAGERVVRLGPSFRSAPKISIDYAVMEKTQRAAVLPVSFGWSDLGAWDAVLDATDRDAAGNTVTPGAVLLDSRDCLVRSDGPVVVGIGLSRIAVIAEPDSVLVCDLGQAQAVKTAVDRLKAAGSPVLDLPARARPESLPAMKAKLDRWLFGSALPLWWALGADHLGGGFVELLDGDGRDLRAPRRARVQARQVYSFAAAGALGWPGPWRAATAHGLDYFLARYRRPDGLFRTLVAADGAPADETAMLYDQAFSLLALASAARALPDRAEVLRAIAAEVVEVLRRGRRDALSGEPAHAPPGGGPGLGGDRPAPPLDRPRRRGGGTLPGPVHPGRGPGAGVLRRRMGAGAGAAGTADRARPPVRMGLAARAVGRGARQDRRAGRGAAPVRVWRGGRRSGPGGGDQHPAGRSQPGRRRGPALAADRAAEGGAEAERGRPGADGAAGGRGGQRRAGTMGLSGDAAARTLARQDEGRRRLRTRAGPRQFALPHRLRHRGAVGARLIRAPRAGKA